MSDDIKFPMSREAANSSGQAFVTDVSSSTASTQAIEASLPSRRKQLQGLDKQVFEHIRRLRGLGYTSVNTVDLARVLGVSLVDVEATIAALVAKGVKIAQWRHKRDRPPKGPTVESWVSGLNHLF